jgi:hypothetical protein
MRWSREQQRMAYVHHEVCEKYNGPRPLGHEAAHSCGNRKCIEPSHLRWATPKENCADKRLHGTNERPDVRGELSWSAKLTESDIVAIRKSKLSSRAIAPLYGVSDGYVRILRRRRKWAHV